MALNSQLTQSSTEFENSLPSTRQKPLHAITFSTWRATIVPSTEIVTVVHRDDPASRRGPIAMHLRGGMGHQEAQGEGEQEESRRFVIPRTKITNGHEHPGQVSTRLVKFWIANAQQTFIAPHPVIDVASAWLLCKAGFAATVIVVSRSFGRLVARIGLRLGTCSRSAGSYRDQRRERVCVTNKGSTSREIRAVSGPCGMRAASPSRRMVQWACTLNFIVRAWAWSTLKVGPEHPAEFAYFNLILACSGKSTNAKIL